MSVDMLEIVEYRCEPWPMRGALEIQPIRGTWTLAPFELRQITGAKGVISCASCGHAALIVDEMGEKGDAPKSLLLRRLLCAKCGFCSCAVLLDWDKRRLFCAAFETNVLGRPDTIVANKEYYHAVDVDDATAQFYNGHPPSDCVIRLVGVAPVIGFFVLDAKGEKLSV